MARGIILLLLVITFTVATAMSSPSISIKQSFMGKRSNSLSSSMATLDSDSSSGKHKLQQDQQSHGDVTTRQNSFAPEAYAVNWAPPDQQSHGDVATSQHSFPPQAYPMKWKRSNQHLQSDIAAHQSFFTPEAYAVNWSPPDQHSHGDVVARQDSFEHEAYRGILPVRTFGRKPSSDDSRSFFSAPKVADASTDAAAVARPPSRGGHGLHVEPGMLFTRKSLLPGTVLPDGTKFGGGDGFPGPQRFVLRADADAIPFSYSQLDTILRMFRIPRGSNKAEQVAATLRTCEGANESPSPDPHTCATSEQAATDFAAASLGVSASELVAVVTVVHGRKDAARYVVAPDGVARIGKAGAAAAVPCHPMAYPYMVHYCHRPADVEALRVELTGLGGDGGHAEAGGATAIAMCHANTTSWDARYFEMLNATRGEEICHFMPRNYVLWLPAADL
ncbi:hypothetical protein SORBI_3002G040201 [Sorghum bicolor]|uniref:BURP domain-containing protein n=1 Tax=Sorghum bicolor TaxID=4558 RepID=A0A1B6Q935_SORBI|nr:hypothetical protein SORBI_3002G040201 [Sorghum bicolor]